jgi:hypothetical protein
MAIYIHKSWQLLVSLYDRLVRSEIATCISPGNVEDFLNFKSMKEIKIEIPSLIR